MLTKIDRCKETAAQIPENKNCINRNRTNMHIKVIYFIFAQMPQQMFFELYFE